MAELNKVVVRCLNDTAEHIHWIHFWSDGDAASVQKQVYEALMKQMAKGLNISIITTLFRAAIGRAHATLNAVS